MGGSGACSSTSAGALACLPGSDVRPPHPPAFTGLPAGCGVASFPIVCSKILVCFGFENFRIKWQEKTSSVMIIALNFSVVLSVFAVCILRRHGLACTNVRSSLSGKTTLLLSSEAIWSCVNAAAPALDFELCAVILPGFPRDKFPRVCRRRVLSAAGSSVGIQPGGLRLSTGPFDLVTRSYIGTSRCFHSLSSCFPCGH